MSPEFRASRGPVAWVAFMTLALTVLSAGCPQKTTVSPTTPGTPTLTSTVTDTSTPADTSTSTATYTATATSTATATPAPGRDWFQSFISFGRFYHSSVVFGGAMWVIAGNDFNGTPNGSLNDVWTSSNGSSWSQATASASFAPRFAHTSLVFGSQMIMIGGWDGTTRFNDVWGSANGSAWSPVTTAAAWTGRNLHASAVFDPGTGSKMWVVGGNDGSAKNDVWYSADGAVWTQATASAAFSARYGHTVVPYNGSLFLVGGYDGSFKNDVWSSADGAVWAPVTLTAAFSGRAAHTCLVFDGALWVIGGTPDGSTAEDDVWTSTDGGDWTQVTAMSGFSPRYGHTGLVFDPGTSLKMWTISGREGANLWLDAWQSP